METILESFIMPLLPEICLVVSALAILLTSLFVKKRFVYTIISCVSMIAAAIFTITIHGQYNNTGFEYCSGLLSADTLTYYFRLLFIFISLMVVLGSWDYSKKFENVYPEYLTLINLALIGMSLLVSSLNLISLFVSLELMALSFYVLTSLMKDKKSSEASLKYVLLGGINSAVLLFGLSLMFGYTGEVDFENIYYTLAYTDEIQPVILLSLGLIITGFSFKIAAVPFHMWAPDVYDGSPTSVTLYLSTASKLAGMSILFRVVYYLFSASSDIAHKAGVVIAILSVLSMFIGNFTAMAQKNIKKMLAYSGICQSGYMLIAIASIGLNYEYLSYTGYSIFLSLFLFAIAFALAEIAVFTGIFTSSDFTQSDDIESLRGLSKKNTFLACVISIGLLSLMGLPMTAGFIGKFAVFTTINNIPILIIGVLNSVISAVYYLRVIKVMWTGEPINDCKISYSSLPMLVMTIAATLLIGFGIFGVNFI